MKNSKKKEPGLTAKNLQKLMGLLKEMDWVIGIPMDIDGDDDVCGLVIGNLAFVETCVGVTIWIPTKDGLIRVEDKGNKDGNC
jgi:hypothetical protein